MLLRRERAGHSADRIFHAARREWRKRIRVRLAIFVAAMGPLALVIWLFSPHGAFLSGAWIGALFGMTLWVWDEPPPFIERWRQGRDGERATAKQLRKLQREGWSARHDLEDKYGNLDHVVVGPGGVFLLDSKNPWGTFAIEEGVLTCHHKTSPRSDYSLPKLPRALGAAARAVEKRLKAELGWIVDVRPVAVFWGDFPAGEASLGDVSVVRGDLLRDWLRRQPGRISPEDQQAVQLAVAALPAAS